MLNYTSLALWKCQCIRTCHGFDWEIQAICEGICRLPSSFSSCYHNIKMSTRCVSNYKKTIYKNIICRNCHVTPNVDSEKIKKRCLNFVNPVIHSPDSIWLLSFLLFVCSSMGSFYDASLRFILFGLRKNGGGRMTSTGRLGTCYSTWYILKYS